MENIIFLKKNSKYVASTSQNKFDFESNDKLVTFAIVGDFEDRIRVFFDHCWNSHGIFYSIFRRKALLDFAEFGKIFFAMDWAVILHLLSKGNVNRSNGSLINFGSRGISRGNNSWKVFRRKKIEWFVPFFDLNFFILRLIHNFTIAKKIRILLLLFKFNLSVSYLPIYSLISNFFNANIFRNR